MTAGHWIWLTVDYLRLQQLALGKTICFLILRFNLNICHFGICHFDTCHFDMCIILLHISISREYFT